MAMAKFSATLLATASVLTLGACGDASVTSSWNQEAGAFLDEGRFGNPTMQNTLAMKGEAGYVLDLANRFASEVPSTITFAFNSSDLDAEAMAALNQQANWIRQFPELRFSVYGHADAVGSNGYNHALGKRRAQAVVNYFVSQGISRSRLKALVSYGETQPVVMTQAEERRNRRTVTTVEGFVKGHPGTLNGKYAQVIFREYVGAATELPTNVATGTSTQEVALDAGGG
jgi:peptidoglycan-associated lipoprotein